MAVVHRPAIGRPERPVVSVCVANYDGERLLPECIDSILAQEGDHAIEIIVHDDASTDGSVALLRQRYPQVEVLASEENVGFCVSNNRMVAHARGEFVLLLNNDAALFPDALVTLLEAAREQAASGIFTLPQFDWETGALVDRGCLLDPFYNPVPNLDQGRHDIAYVIGACLFVPRALWHDLGGFPEWIGSIAEDLYLCSAARLRGHRVQVTSTSGYKHRQGASFGGNRVDAGRLQTSYRRRRLSERNKTFVLAIFTPTLLAWPLLTVHLVLLALEGSALAVVRRDWRIFNHIYGNVFVSLAREFARLLKLRRNAQQTRNVTAFTFWRAFVPFPRKLAMLFRYGVPTLS